MCAHDSMNSCTYFQFIINFFVYPTGVLNVYTMMDTNYQLIDTISFLYVNIRNRGFMKMENTENAWKHKMNGTAMQVNIGL